MDAILGFIYDQKSPNTVCKAKRDPKQSHSTIAKTLQGNRTRLPSKSDNSRTPMPAEVIILGNYGDSLHIVTQDQSQSLYCPTLFVS